MVKLTTSGYRLAGHPPRHVAYAAVLLLLLPAGCAHVTPDTPQAAPTSARAPSDPTPPQVVSKVAPPAPTAPAPVAPAPKSAAPTPVARRAPVVTPPALDLNSLKEQLRATKAIGVFTKLSLKNKVDDLLDQFREYYQGKTTLTMAVLRRSYDLLMMKVLSLLQDEDQQLAAAIVSSREAIWGLLVDPTKFATL